MAIRRAYPLPPVPGEPAPAPLFTARLRNPAVLDTIKTVNADLADLFAKGSIPLSRRSAVSPVKPGSEWRLADPDYERQYRLSWVDHILSVHLEPLRDLAGDREAAKFHQVCAGRSIDGLAIYQAVRGNLPVLPPSVAGAYAAAINAAGNELRGGCWRSTATSVSRTRPPGTRQRLEYGMEAVADHPEEGTASLEPTQAGTAISTGTPSTCAPQQEGARMGRPSASASSRATSVFAGCPTLAGGTLGGHDALWRSPTGQARSGEARHDGLHARAWQRLVCHPSRPAVRHPGWRGDSDCSRRLRRRHADRAG